MSRKKKSASSRRLSSAARKWIAHKQCPHWMGTVVDPQGRTWRYCHRCNYYEIVGLVDPSADEEGA